MRTNSIIKLFRIKAGINQLNSYKNSLFKDLYLLKRKLEHERFYNGKSSQELEKQISDLQTYILVLENQISELYAEDSEQRRSIFIEKTENAIKIYAPNKFIQIASFFISSKYREAFVGDLWELTEDMKVAGYSNLWIKFVSLWHISLALKSSLMMSLKDRIGLEPKSEREVGK